MLDTTWWRHGQHYTPVQYITYMIQTLIKNYLGMQVIRDPLMIFVKFTMLRKKYGKNHLERHLEICKKPGEQVSKCQNLIYMNLSTQFY